MAKKTAGSTKKSVLNKKIVSAPSERPNWPALQPLVPSETLFLDTVLEDQIILIRKLFTSSLCQNYVKFLSGLPLTITPGQPKKGEALRVNGRFQIDDADFAERLWNETGLRQLVESSEKNWGGEVCSLNPRIRIYRYTKGQFFDQHYDESNVLVLPTEPPAPAKTTWTLLIYLTSCTGGETAFYPEFGQAKHMFNKKTQNVDPIVIGTEVGMALLHKHGDDCLLHEGREVTEGEKWVIRSDLCVKR